MAEYRRKKREQAQLLAQQQQLQHSTQQQEVDAQLLSQEARDRSPGQPVTCIIEAFVNPEDLSASKAPEAVVNDPDVERVRRAHLNDLENILPYLLIALVYITTGPNAIVARVLFRIAALSRIIHTAVYAFRPVPQPSRAIAFLVTFVIAVYMTFHVMVKTIMYI